MSEFTLKRGLSNVVVAPVIADNEEAFTTGEVRKLIPAGEMAVTVDNEKTQTWFDNTVFAEIGREGASEITITGAGLRAAAIAALNNKKIDETTGAVLDSGNFGVVQYFALGAEKLNIDGTKELVWFTKGSFAIPDESAKTIGEDTDASGTELTYAAIPTIHRFAATGETCKRVVIDTEDTKVKADADWFAQVVTPDNVGTICEKAAG